MTSTNLKFNDVDLIELFSSENGNTSYTGTYPNLSTIDTYQGTQNTLKGSNTTGYSINGNDIVSIFHPIYYDRTGHGSSTSEVIDIPSWCTKIGFVLQGKGGKGGPAFTNYWQKINIPQRYQYNNQNYNVLSYSVQNSTFWDSRNYAYNRRSGIKCWFTRYNAGTNYGRTTNYQAQYGANYTTNYTRDAVENATYYGSGGGGGGCTAGVYTIDLNNPITSMVYSTDNSSYSFCQLYFDSDEYVVSYSGNDTTENTNVTTYSNPQYYDNVNTDNTSIDLRGSGGSYLIVSNTNKLTTKFGSNGSNGTTTSGQTNNTGGASGYSNSSEILSHFMPNIDTSKGYGATGSTTSQYNDVDNMHFRYWFIR
jgi:hypothetical protein